MAGIGTGVGKTLASAILCKALNAAYWKPVQTGYLSGSGDRDATEVQALTGCKIYPEAYIFEQPLSPHAAAHLEGRELSLSSIQVPDHHGNLIIEGAGGLMVPLNYRDLYIDLLAQWRFPVVLVVRHYLGNINHTLLSLEALRSRKIPLAGLIISGDPLPFTNEAIAALGAEPPVLLTFTELEKVDAAVVRQLAAGLDISHL